MTSLTVPADRPILFSGEMVRAILEGRKTQTRRVVKAVRGERGTLNYAYLDLHCDPARAGRADAQKNREAAAKMWCPYGQPGDRLWVRETWADDTRGGTLYAADPFFDGADISWNWKPSIHMHRHRSRLTLNVTDVRVERLQDISEHDARAEGVEPDHSDLARYTPHVSGFAFLWQRLNGPRGYGWNVNPWVWVISFSRAPSPDTETRE